MNIFSFSKNLKFTCFFMLLGHFFDAFPHIQIAAQFLNIVVFQFLLSSHYSFQICHLSIQFLSLHYITTESLFSPSCLSLSQLRAQQLSFISLSVLHTFASLAILKAHLIVWCNNISKVARHTCTCKTGCIHIFFSLVQYFTFTSDIAASVHGLISIRKMCL